jgi:general stress protein YciG
MEKQPRGFARLAADEHRALCSLGGKAAHQKGVAHQWSKEEASAAGRKGGNTSRGGRGKLPADAHLGSERE